MKIYSDTLTREDLLSALPKGVAILDLSEIRGARVRARGWNVRLWSDGNRHRNSGTHGAATWELPAASYDEHGYWMARLFELDPEARLANWDGAAAFREGTEGKFEARVTA